MFNSGITAKNLIDEVKGEVDIALEIPDANYISWLNSLEQLLYRDIIQEQKEHIVQLPEIPTGLLGKLVTDENEDAVTFEDLHAVYIDKTQLIKSTVTTGTIIPDTYYKQNNELSVNVRFPKELKIICYVRPKLKTEDNFNDKYVMVPVEFIDLVKAKLRGEAYKLANEDNLAAKWLNDYNVLLETFKMWITNKTPLFGM